MLEIFMILSEISMIVISDRVNTKSPHFFHVPFKDSKESLDRSFSELAFIGEFLAHIHCFGL